MPWQNQSGGDRKNPWGRGPGNNGGSGGGPRGPWDGGDSKGGGDSQPPDLDELLRKAQANLRQIMPGGAGGAPIAVIALVVVAVLWLASGLYIIEPGVTGVIQRFGQLETEKTTEGLGYHLPWPVETITKVNVSEVRRMPIGFTEAGGPGGGTRDVPEESLMLTADANIVDLDLVVLWNIKSAEQFLFNIENPENTIKKVAESAIREVVGQTEMMPIITKERAQISDNARKIMQQNLDSYKSGINIGQVLIQRAEVHPDVQEAFQDVQSAKQDAINVQNQAETYRQDILPRARGAAIQIKQNAEGYRDSAVAKATGEAKRFDEIYTAYQQGKDVTRSRIYIETMEAVLGRAQKTILDGKAGNIVPYLPLDTVKPPPAPVSTPLPAPSSLTETKP